MAERQETSVMVSIQEILRDAQSREEQEKAEAEQRAREAEQRRLDDIRRKQEEEAARMRDARFPAGRPPSTDDIAAAVRFFASEEASFITGQVLNVAGGWML